MKIEHIREPDHIINMNMVHYLLAKAGCSEHFYKWLPDDFTSVWSAWNDAPELVQLLLALKIDVATTLRTVVSVSPKLTSILDTESVYNAAVLLCRYLPEPELIAAIQTAHPLATVIERLDTLV